MKTGQQLFDSPMSGLLSISTTVYMPGRDMLQEWVGGSQYQIGMEGIQLYSAVRFVSQSHLAP
jgi:hypothetical protein